MRFNSKRMKKQFLILLLGLSVHIQAQTMFFSEKRSGITITGSLLVCEEMYQVVSYLLLLPLNITSTLKNAIRNKQLVFYIICLSAYSPAPQNDRVRHFVRTKDGISQFADLIYL